MFALLMMLGGAIVAAVLYLIWLFVGVVGAILVAIFSLASAIGGGLATMLGMPTFSGWLMSMFAGLFILWMLSNLAEALWATKK